MNILFNIGKASMKDHQDNDNSERDLRDLLVPVNVLLGRCR